MSAPAPVDSILDTVGNTPLLPLRRVVGPGARVLGKLEASNPAGSVKDRIALSMIRAAEQDGRLAYGFWAEGPHDRPSVDELVAAVDEVRP